MQQSVIKVALFINIYRYLLSPKKGSNRKDAWKWKSVYLTGGEGAESTLGLDINKGGNEGEGQPKSGLECQLRPPSCQG